MLIVAPVTANRQCFLTGVFGLRPVFQHFNEAEVALPWLGGRRV